MTFNLNWPRWITASVNVHFDVYKPADLKMIVEGQPRDTNTNNDILELRMDGPDSLEVSKDYWHLNLEINSFIQSIIDNKNIYRHDTVIGQVTAIYTSIPVVKCGNQPGDDESFVGCLKLKQVPGRELIEISRFGQIEPNLALEQSTIEGHYLMELDLTN